VLDGLLLCDLDLPLSELGIVHSKRVQQRLGFWLVGVGWLAVVIVDSGGGGGDKLEGGEREIEKRNGHANK
jgi:hypothetical protein